MARKADCDSFSRTVLAVRFSALGDVALTIPELYGACLANPDVRIVLVTRRHPARMAVGAPRNLTVEGVDLDLYKGPAGMRRLVAELSARYSPDMLIDLHDVIRTKLMRLFAALRGLRTVTIDKGRREKKALTRPRNKILIPLRTTPERYRDTLRRAGLQTGAAFTSIYPDGADASLFAAASQPKAPGEKWIAVAPFAAHAGKVYPPELMERVVERLAGAGGRKIFVFGFGEHESETIRNWAAGHPEIINMAALGIGLPAEMALLSYCDVMLSMDSANMHLASLAGCRVVSVWGATHPYCGFMGAGQRPEDTVQLDMTCRPCSVFGNKPCLRGDLHCLRGIPPQLIIDKVENVLSQS